MKIKKSVYFLVCLVLLSNKMFSQTGPAGVGSSSSNVMWLKSEDITSLLDGDDITTWTDASGNGNSVSQPNSSFKPVYKTNILNSFPAVRFEKANGRLRRTGFTTFPTSAITAIYVNKTSETSDDATLSYASSATNNDFLLFSSNSLNLYRSSNTNSGVTFNDDTFNITNASWQSTGGSVEIWKNGSRDFTGSVSSGTNITTGGSLAIAGEQDSVDGGYDAGQAHFGDFTEVMIFNIVLNQAQNIIIANYLAAKYGISISNDRFAYESTHSYDVAGIGRENATNTHLAAMSDAILQIDNASGINADQEYLLFGHDNEDVTTSWTTTEAPNSGTNIQRLAREWRLDETGDVGTIDFVVDVATFPTLPVGHTMYALMVDSDGDFSEGASVYEMTLVSGTEYTVTGIDFSDGDYISIAAVEPKIQHTNTTGSGLESTNASIEISLNFIPQTDKTVEFTTVDGSANSGSDYTAATGTTATILAGNSSATYTVSVTDDGTGESTETFTSTLSSPIAGVTLGTNTVFTYNILDNDISRKVSFDVATDANNESTTSVNVNLSIDTVDAINPTSVDYAVTGGTASGSGTDYTLTSGTVTFAAGITAASFSFTVNNDVLKENNETIIVGLSNPINCNLDGSGFIEYTYTINDDDPNPTLQFTSTSSLGSEAVASVNFEVNIDAISAINASATYTVTGTASGAGTDYTLANGTVTFLAGSTTANLTATINNDSSVELNETIIITLSSPINATLGANTVHTYTITDDDTFGYTGPGGVGDSTSNTVWLDADEISSLADDDDLTSWSDVSGNSNDFSQSATFSPVYKTSIVNGFPVSRFNKTNNRIRKTSFTGFASTAATAIFVNKNNAESGDAHISYAAGGSGGNDFLLFNSSNLALFVNGSSTSTGVSLNDNNWHIINASWQSSGGNYEIWKDGTESSTGSVSAGATITSGGTLAIAGEQDSVDGGYVNGQAHSGDYPEVIMYNVYLNTAQQIIVANYLSAKYDITIANDFYTQDDVANGDFDFNVAGIGRDNSDSSFHADSQGNGIVRMLTPSSLDDDDFLFWGRNNKTTYSFTTNTSNYKERISSNWRVSNRNDLGTVTVEFDMTGIDLTGKQTCAPLQLIVDNDSDLESPTSTYTLTNTTGNIYQATEVTFADGDYFTLEYIDTIVVDGTQFYNGSGAANVPNTSDDCYKLLVKSTATGSHTLTENANVREIEVESGGILVIDSEKGLTVTNGIQLDGDIRLIDKAQIIQNHTTGSQITGSGKLYVDQNSDVTSKYLYNYFSPPVVTPGASTYTVVSVMKDGTTPTSSSSTALDINFITGLDGNFNSSPIEIPDRWIYTYDDIGGGTYAYDNNGGVGSTKTISPGKGYLFKGPGRAQNYTFVGTPNDGNYTYAGIPTDVNILLGNPYPSAFNVQEFLADNNAIGSTIYLWQQAAVDDAEDTLGHFGSGYNGDYAIINSSTSTAGTLPSEIDFVIEAEDATLGGSATIVDDKVELTTASDEISFDYSELSVSVDSLFIIYSATALKTIDIDINAVSELTGVSLPSTGGVVDTLGIELDIEIFDVVLLKSNDANTSLIDKVFVKQKYSYAAPPFNYFAIGQGFFFNVDTAGSLVFNNSQRAFIPEGTGGSFFFKNDKKSTNLPVLKLGMNFRPTPNQIFHKQIAITFKKGNSFDYDRGFDSEIQGIQATDMYWKFPGDDNFYGIAGVQAINDDLEVPLEIVIETSQTINITKDEIENMDRPIYLKDTQTNITYNITNTEAKIYLEAGTHQNRFYLVFKDATLDLEKNVLVNSIAVFHNKEAKELSIKNNGNSKFNKLQIFNLLGQKIIEVDNLSELNKKEIIVKTKVLRNSIYILKIQTNKGEISKKFY